MVPSGGQPGKVDGSGTEHPDAEGSPCKEAGKAELEVVLLGGIRAGGEVTECDDGFAEHPGACGGPDGLAIDERPSARRRPEPLAEEREVDDAEHRLALLQESERHGAERAARRVVDGAVDGVEGPGLRRPGRGPTAALLLAEEADAGRRLRQQVPDGALDGEVDAGDRVPVALG